MKPPWPHPVFIVYEGQDGEVVNQRGEVFLVEEYDTLHVTGPKIAFSMHLQAK